MEDLNQWLTLIANFAVVGGLIFLSLEVRHNTKVSQSHTQMELLSLWRAAQNWKKAQQFADIVVRAETGYDTLSPAEREQFHTFVYQLLAVWEHAHGANQRGLMSESYWHAWNDTFHPILKNEGWRTVWESVRHTAAKEFQDHVDSYVTDAT